MSATTRPAAGRPGDVGFDRGQTGGVFAAMTMTFAPCCVSVLMKVTCDEALASSGPTTP